MGLTQVNSEGIKDGEIKNADVNASAAIAGSKLAAATTSAAGSMSAADKTKLDGVATSATANPSAPALTGSTNNTVCTVTGANAIQGEANLTFDGTNLGINNSSALYPLHFKNAMSSSPSWIHMEVTGSNSVGGGGGIAFDTSASNTESNNSKYLATIKGIRNSLDNGSNDLVFSTTHKDLNNNEDVEKLRIQSDGNVKINDGNLVIGTSGHGIDFSAQTQSTSTTNSELLDHYEEGNWVPVFANGLVASAYETNGQRGAYTRIGNVVYITGALHLSTTSTQNNNVIDISGLPFTSGSSGSNIWDAGGVQNYYQDVFYNANDFSGIVFDNDTKIRLYKKSDGTYLTGSDVDSGREIRFSGSYLVPT